MSEIPHKHLFPDLYQPRLEDWLPYEQTGNVRWRPSHLHGEMEKLWNAQSFMTWRYGVYFNTHITILAQPLGMNRGALFRLEDRLGRVRPAVRWFGVQRLLGSAGGR